MIRLDDRVGSGELLPLFRPFGVSVEKVRLEFGDLCWQGNGPKGLCMVGVERKRIDDLVQSMQSGRLSGHQLPGMVENYDFGYLVVEGFWKADPQTGELLVSMGRDRWVKRGIQVRAIHNYLFGLSLRAGMLVWRTGTDRETVEFVVDQYRMWTEKRWDEHKAHEQVYTGGASMDLSEEQREGGGGRRLYLNVKPPTNAELLASVMPGLGKKLAYRVGKKFGTPMQMMLAEADRWAEVKGVSVKMGQRLRRWFYE